MPIKGATLLLDGTVTPSAGTSKTFTEMGETIKNGVKVADLSVADARLRPTITCINRPAVLNSLGVYTSKDKKTVKIVMPKLLASGVIAFPLREIRLEDHPEMTEAEKRYLNSYAAQVLADSDFQQFILNGATA